MQLKDTFEASKNLLHETLMKLTGTTEYIVVIKKAIVLYLDSAREVYLACHEDQSIVQSFKTMRSSLEKYVIDSIGKPFGTPSRFGSWSEKNAETEIRVHSSKYRSML